MTEITQGFIAVGEKASHHLTKGNAALLQFPPPPFFFIFMIDYDREFHADSEKYKNIALKINGKCSNSTLKF